MAEQMTYLEAIARSIYEGRNGRGAPAWARRHHGHKQPYLDDAKAALTAIGMTEAQQLMPVDSLAIVPDDVAKRRAEHAARVADAYDRIRRAGRPAARPGSEG